MINTNEINLRDDLMEEYGVPFGFEYKESIFIFETAEQRQEWLDTCSTEDLDNIIAIEEEQSTEA